MGPSNDADKIDHIWTPDAAVGVYGEGRNNGGKWVLPQQTGQQVIRSVDMPTLQEQEQPIDEKMANSIIAATPEWWKAACLEIVWCPKHDGSEGFLHLITSPEGHKDIVTATEDMYALTFQRADLFKQHGKQWRKVVYSVKEVDGGKWDYAVRFDD